MGGSVPGCQRGRKRAGSRGMQVTLEQPVGSWSLALVGAGCKGQGQGQACALVPLSSLLLLRCLGRLLSQHLTRRTSTCETARVCVHLHLSVSLRFG